MLCSSSNSRYSETGNVIYSWVGSNSRYLKTMDTDSVYDDMIWLSGVSLSTILPCLLRFLDLFAFLFWARGFNLCFQNLFEPKFERLEDQNQSVIHVLLQIKELWFTAELVQIADTLENKGYKLCMIWYGFIWLFRVSLSTILPCLLGFLDLFAFWSGCTLPCLCSGRFPALSTFKFGFESIIFVSGLVDISLFKHTPLKDSRYSNTYMCIIITYYNMVWAHDNTQFNTSQWRPRLRSRPLATTAQRLDRPRAIP